MKIQAAILDLERRVGVLTGYPTIPGTSLQRIQVDRRLLERDGIKVPPGRESMFVWSLGLGAAHEPKTFVTGMTIPHAIKRAQKVVANWELRQQLVGA
jgi:hypothetical protein